MKYGKSYKEVMAKMKDQKKNYTKTLKLKESDSTTVKVLVT